MDKVVFRKLDAATPRETDAKTSKVKFKRVTKDGRFVSVRTVSTESDSFGRDFTRAFGANVKKARAENKRVTGSPDSAPAKG
ncbi:MAG TPA: hypothetical protein VEZ70_10790 [Allosphingosinicella sp.]|nr:hypothetical protein [Allosphingosinicella sp.]